MSNNKKRMIDTYSSIYDKLYKFDKKYIKKKKEVIKKNLKELKIHNYQNLKVMDVGTGIQGYIFYLLKFKKIFHYDLNPIPIKNINSLNLKNFKSELKNFNKDKLKIKFDLIYLYGVVHHIKIYKFFLKNILKNVNKDGKIFIRIYRSGSFSFFIVDFLRKIMTNLKSFNNFLQKNEIRSEPNDVISDLIDDIFVPNLYLFSIDNLIKNFKRNGFKLIFNSKYKYYNHVSHHSIQGISLGFQNCRSLSRLSYNFNIKHVDQILDIKYKEPYILDNIKLMKKIISNKRNYKKEDIYKFTVDIYKISQGLHHKKKISSKQNHEILNKILKNFIRMQKK